VPIADIPIGGAQYHGMNIKVTKRFSDGLSFLASYGALKNLRQTRSLNPQALAGLDNFDNTPLVRESDQNVDISQTFITADSYELPFGKGRKCGSAAPGIVNQLIGGWQLNWDVTYQSGNVVDYPNALQNTPGSAKLDNPTGKQWFNTSLWKKSD